MLDLILATGSGIAIGWIACQWFTNRPLVRQIIQMRAMGFDPVPRTRRAPEQTEYEQFSVNET